MSECESAGNPFSVSTKTLNSRFPSTLIFDPGLGLSPLISRLKPLARRLTVNYDFVYSAFLFLGQL